VPVQGANASFSPHYPIGDDLLQSIKKTVNTAQIVPQKAEFLTKNQRKKTFSVKNAQIGRLNFVRYSAAFLG
jgi:hypothetical protein